MSVFGLVPLIASLSLAHAYVPPSFFVVRMLARKHQTIENGRFRSKVTFYRKNGEAFLPLNETLLLENPEHATVRISDSTGNEVATSARKLMTNKAGDPDRPVPYDLLLIRDSANIYEHFKTLGLPLKTEGALYADKEGNMPYKSEPYVALDRLERGTAVVVGDRTRKSEGAVLWVEKDSYLPLRAIFPISAEGGSAQPLEFRLGGYQVHKSFLYPKTLQIYRNGTLWAKVETQDVSFNTSSGLEEPKGKADVDGELKEAVETYLKWVR